MKVPSKAESRIRWYNRWSTDAEINFVRRIAKPGKAETLGTLRTMRENVFARRWDDNINPHDVADELDLQINALQRKLSGKAKAHPMVLGDAA